MKVKIFSDTDKCRLEDNINMFIRKRFITEIKYQMSTAPNSTQHSAMIIYEEPITMSTIINREVTE